MFLQLIYSFDMSKALTSEVVNSSHKIRISLNKIF
jgi:hypothetical protein